MEAKQTKLEDKQAAILGSHEQKIKFLEHFQNHKGPGFGSFFAEWGLGMDAKAKLPPNPWCEEVFRIHPWEDCIEEDHKLFCSLPRYELRQTTTWYKIHIKMVEEGILRSDFFAYERTSKQSGLNNIQHALDATTEQKQEVDKCARNIMRNMGGIPRVRGGLRAINDCPTAKFYWSYKLACDIEEELLGCKIKIGPSEQGQVASRRLIYQALRGTIWDTLVDTLGNRVTMFSNKRILAALVGYIIETSQGRKTKIRRIGLAKEGILIKELGSTVPIHHLSLEKPADIIAVFKKVEF